MKIFVILSFVFLCLSCNSESDNDTKRSSLFNSKTSSAVRVIVSRMSVVGDQISFTLSTSHFFQKNIPVYYQIFTSSRNAQVDFIGSKKSCETLSLEERSFLSCENSEAGFLYFPSGSYDQEFMVGLTESLSSSRLEFRMVIPIAEVSANTHRAQFSFNLQEKEIFIFENRDLIPIELPAGKGSVGYFFKLGEGVEHASRKDVVVSEGFIDLNPEHKTKLFVKITDDNVYEKDESFTIFLRGDQNIFPNNQSVERIIVKLADDEEPPKVTFPQWVVSESEGQVLLPFSLSWPTEVRSAFTISQILSTGNSTATQNGDYVFQDRKFELRSTEGAVDFHVPLTIIDDNFVESEEFVSLVVKDASEVVLPNLNEETFFIQKLFIRDNDEGVIPRVSISSPSIVSVSAGDVARVTVKVQGALQQSVKVPYTTVLGSATLDDFEYKSGVIIFLPSSELEQTQEITIRTSLQTSRAAVHFFIQLLPVSNGQLSSETRVRTNILRR